MTWLWNALCVDFKMIHIYRQKTERWYTCTIFQIRYTYERCHWSCRWLYFHKLMKRKLENYVFTYNRRAFLKFMENNFREFHKVTASFSSDDVSINDSFCIADLKNCFWCSIYVLAHTLWTKRKVSWIKYQIRRTLNSFSIRKKCIWIIFFKLQIL